MNNNDGFFNILKIKSKMSHDPNFPHITSIFKQPAFHYTMIIIGIVIVLAVLSKWSDSTSYSKPFLKKIKALIEQATRYNSMAQQDTAPLVQLMHCNYAMSYANVARLIASDTDIENITGIDIHELINYLSECQAYCVKNIGQQCPKIKIEGVYSIGSGWS